LSVLLGASGEFGMTIEHYWAHFDGIVVARKDNVRFPPWSRNRATRYVIRESGGREYVYYADSSEGAPSESALNGFPVGTRLRKQRRHMDYEENGQAMNDFPLGLYILPMMLDSFLLGAAVILDLMIRARDRRNRELQAAFQRAMHRLETG